MTQFQVQVHDADDFGPLVAALSAVPGLRINAMVAPAAQGQMGAAEGLLTVEVPQSAVAEFASVIQSTVDSGRPGRALSVQRGRDRLTIKAATAGESFDVLLQMVNPLPDRSRSRAILIGDSTYDDPGLPDLPAARNSVTAMAELLASDLCGWPGDRITVLTDSNSPDELIRQVNEAAGDTDETLFLYYVGHGLRTLEGDLVLALTGTDPHPDRLAGTGLSYEALVEILRNSPASSMIVILDCYIDEMGLSPDYLFNGGYGNRYSAWEEMYFVAASAAHSSFAAPSKEITYFSDIFTQVAREGIPGRPTALGLAEIVNQVEIRLRRAGLSWLVDSGGVRIREQPFARNAVRAELAEQGTEAVGAYLRAASEQSLVRLWSSKLLIVGEATVGKTSLAKRLTDKAFDPNEGQTHGVRVDPLSLAHPSEPNVSMNLNVWDFGGQLEYRATQRFYLTDRSLFLLVWNARARWQDGKVAAWLDVLAARAPESPVLLVATHGDEQSAATLPSDLQDRFPQIAGFFTVDSASRNGIDALRDAVRQHAANLPMMGAEWPEDWAAAADAVRAMPGYAATTRHVFQSMADANVTDPTDQQVIARWLHDLGDVVYFADDLELAQKVILRPSWLDSRITAVLDSDDVAARRGVLTRAERDRLWADLDDPDLNNRLVRMMERFDLAYRVGDAEGSDEVALVVERLDEARPAAVEKVWLRAGTDPAVQEIGIAYRLKSRQAGIPTWFIAREHRYTTGLHWSHGALLHDRDPDHPAWALLVDDGRDQPTVELRVRGRFPVRFLSALAEAFEQILDKRYPKLLERQLVPCLCTGRTASPCGHLFPLDELILEATDPDPDGDRKVRCPRSRTKLDAHTMLDGLRGSTLNAAVSGLEDGMGGLREAIAQQSSQLSRIEQRQLATLNGIRSLLEQRSATGVHCPSLFEIADLGRNIKLQQTYQLRLWCEWPYGPDGPHALPDGQGVYQIRRLPDWLRTYLPYLSALATALGLIVPLVGSGLKWAGTALSDRTTAGFETVAKLADDLKELPGGEDRTDGLFSAVGRGPQSRLEVGADFRILRAALTDLDKHTVWGGLSPVERPEDQRIVYLCREHVRALEYPYRG